MKEVIVHDPGDGREIRLTVQDNIRMVTPDGLRLPQPVNVLDIVLEQDGVRLAHSMPYGWAREIAQKILDAA